jgi:uncharacterized protein (DUF305 family)
MVDAHSKLLEEADKLARLKRAHVSPPGENVTAEILRDAPEEGFDRAFVAWAIESQASALALARRAVSTGHDPNVKALAAKVAAHEEKQLEICRGLAQALGPDPARRRRAR